jgi:hypothetical protein
MKLKKKHFKKLKEIKEEVWGKGYFGLLGERLNNLIIDIESVQKPKFKSDWLGDLDNHFVDKTSKVETIQEKPITGTTSFLDACTKFQEDFYENLLNEGRTDNSTEFKGGLRSIVESNDGVSFLENYEYAPKIGDVGYFWDDEEPKLIEYGILKEIREDEFPFKSHLEVYTRYFSKTPPELK